MQTGHVHLVCGPTGAGKTTQALRIAQQKQGEIFVLDECLKPLSLPDSHDDAALLRAYEKAEFCTIKILQQVTPLLAQNKNIVLDLSAALFKRAGRERIRAWAMGLNAEVTLYYVCVSKHTRRKRLLNRNASKGETYSFHIPEWAFDLAEEEFEPPSDEEGAIIISNEDSVMASRGPDH